MTRQEKEAELMQLEISIVSNMEYLHNTDYEVVKSYEFPDKYPLNSETKSNRENARKSINSAQERVEELNKIQVEEPIINDKNVDIEK